ncbi:MAG: hypothetical protein ACKVOO_01815 [Burkholderiaceae bacterium]
MKQLHKLLAIAAIGATTLAASLPAQALTATGSFDVQVNLFPRCIVTIPTTTLVLNYVSFQTSASSNTLAYTVQCTNLLPYDMSLSNTTLTALDLPVTLAVPATGTGDGTATSYNITGSIIAGQSGTCAQQNDAVTGNYGNNPFAGVTGTAVGFGTACQATSAAQTLTVTY